MRGKLRYITDWVFAAHTSAVAAVPLHPLPEHCSIVAVRRLVVFRFDNHRRDLFASLIACVRNRSLELFQRLGVGSALRLWAQMMATRRPRRVPLVMKSLDGVDAAMESFVIQVFDIRDGGSWRLVGRMSEFATEDDAKVCGSCSVRLACLLAATLTALLCGRVVVANSSCRHVGLCKATAVCPHCRGMLRG